MRATIPGLTTTRAPTAAAWAWQPPSYDPELNLVYIPTGNPNPVGAGQSRKGDNLFSCSVVALNPDTRQRWSGIFQSLAA